MKTDLATSIVAAIIGVVVSYFVCGIFLPEISSVSFDILEVEGDTDYSLTDPDPEVFNYRAVDPTVEVYVGQCEQDTNGNCLENTVTPETPSPEVTPEPEETPEENGSTDMPDIPDDIPVEEDTEDGSAD